MIGRVFAGLIVAFWVVMMASLVRMEFFPQAVALDAVPRELVLGRVFANPEPAKLDIFYRGSRIGFCRVEIAPQANLDSEQLPAADQPPQFYRVKSHIMMGLSVMGKRSRLQWMGTSVFDARYQVNNFQLKASVGEGHVNINGDKATGRVRVQSEFADWHDDREFGFQELQSTNLANAVGMPGLAGTLGVGSSSGSIPTLATTTVLGSLKIGNASVRTYVVESKVNDNLWAKIWISERGEVLQVSTSMGLTMLAADLWPGESAGSGAGGDGS